MYISVPYKGQKIPWEYCFSIIKVLIIHCDHGSEFENVLLKDLCELYDVKLTFLYINHPELERTLSKIQMDIHSQYFLGLLL